MVDVLLTEYKYVRGFVMQTKLTLRLEDELIKQAKEHAKEQGKSLSQIVADYFTIFTKQNKKQKIAPITQSLIGILKDSSLDEKDYKKHLEEKYL
jgi:hypothetical protein